MASDKFWACDIETLLKWILAGEEQGEILGIHQGLFHIPDAAGPLGMRRYGRGLETPLGVAAGPHTQLSQNLIAAWLCGARYLELKTVQVLDELEVTKPCIDMGDEGYNCEWSQELKLHESFDEYLNAWILIHILKDRFSWGDKDELGCIFNMSVGYNLEGIQSPTVQGFLDSMADCSQAKAAKIARLASIYPRVKDLNIPDCISDNITISTMHGCPPDEVEKIGRYFIEERGLHTTIKLNPTLLGPEGVRGILNDKLGFKVTVPDLAFEHDQKWDDGVALIKALTQSARDKGTSFNLKLTNTLETLNQDQNLPGNEQMVYMSGRALHPISINLAARLQEEFNGSLDMSFSAGVDMFNFPATLACGLKPVTICSDILKPGGYGRLSQYLEAASQAMTQAGADCLDEFILARAGGGQLNQAALNNLRAYADKAVQAHRHQKAAYPYDSIKYERELPKFDCAAAPCMAKCPAGQEVPRYLDFAARGEWAKAYLTVMATNPFPNMQGKVCDHLCQMKCTRLNYDDPLLIREIKRVIAERHSGPSGLTPAAPNGLRAAIIGAGPSGLSCAHFLALNGYSVEVFEAKGISGGMAADAIPAFRLDDEALATDIQAILDLGVKLHKDCRVDRRRFDELLSSHDYIYIAVGAQNSLSLNIPGMDSSRVFDQLSFLSAVRRGNPPDLGKNVAVIGGGNSAMDAARTAKRLVGPKGRVIIVYRRTMSEMPADLEEVQGALEEGVELLELCAPEQVLIEPERISGLSCARMELGGVDASGRPRPIKLPGSEFTLEIDSLIPAIGQRVDLDFFPHDELRIDPVTLETQIMGVFAGGDASRGASSLIKAIADGQKAANAIMAKAGQEGKVQVSPADDREPDWNGLKLKQARRQEAALVPEREPASRLDFEPFVGTLDDDIARAEAARCLQCDIFCNVCATVCPNRANLALEMGKVSYPIQSASQDNGQARVDTQGKAGFSQKYQIVNLGDFCNECGNCTTFCPSSGAPYKDKARFHLTRSSFESSARGYFFSATDILQGKIDGISCTLQKQDDGYVWESRELKVNLDKNYFAKKVEFKTRPTGPVSLAMAAEMAVWFEGARGSAPFNLA